MKIDGYSRHKDAQRFFDTEKTKLMFFEDKTKV